MSTPGIVVTARRALGALLLDRAVISDRTVERTAGGTTTTWTPRAAPVACRFGPVSDSEATLAAGLVQGKAASVVTLPVGTPIAEQAKVRNTATGREWLVVANLTPESVWQTTVRVLVREA